MGIDIGGAFTITGLVTGVQSFKIAGASDAFVIDPAGRTTYPNQICFLAGGYGSTDPGWWAQPAGWTVWNYMNNISYNVGGGYANSRFTAPVAGAYLFHWTCYHYRPGVGQGAYIHPMFFVNGAERNLYRILAYWAPTGYSFDSDMMDIIYLNAGDYVDVHINFSNAGQSGYPYYSQFAGCLVG
jgi:hypothetical protein